MASHQTDMETLRSGMSVGMYDHDPGTTAATVVSADGGTTLKYVDMSLYGRFLCAAMSSTLSGNGITKLEIVACTDTAFSSVVVIKDSGTVAADAVGDFVIEECSSHELAQEGSDNSNVSLRYAAGRITCHTAEDEAVVTYIAAEPKFAYQDLTADTIA